MKLSAVQSSEKVGGRLGFVLNLNDKIFQGVEKRVLANQVRPQLSKPQKFSKNWSMSG